MSVPTPTASAAKWREIWLKKLERACVEKGLKKPSGCGMRLGEIQFLKRQDFEFDRDIINVQQGKGKKDRIVMLDEALKPGVVDFLKQGAGKTWFFEGQFPGQKISTRTIELIFEHCCQKAGIQKKGGIHTCPSNQMMTS
jgi:integrase